MDGTILDSVHARLILQAKQIMTIVRYTLVNCFAVLFETIKLGSSSNSKGYCSKNLTRKLQKFAKTYMICY